MALSGTSPLTGLDPDELNAPNTTLPKPPQSPTTTWGATAPQPVSSPTTTSPLGGLDPDATPTTAPAPTSPATQSPTPAPSTVQATTAPAVTPAPTPTTQVGSTAGSVTNQLQGQPKYASGIDTGYTERDQDVASIAQDYMKQDSLLMQQSQAQGRQLAAERGMLNSTLAGTAGMAAMLEHIVPMASQSAQQNYGRNLSNQEAHQASALSKQDAGEQGILAEQAFHQNQDLSRQDYQQTSSLSRQDYEQTAALSSQEWQQQKDLAAQKYTFDRGLMELDFTQKQALAQQGFEFEQALQQSEQTFQMSVAQMELDQRQFADAQSAVNEVWNNYQEQYFSIMGNPDLTAEQRQRQLADAERLAKAQIQTIDATYGSDFNTTMKFYNDGGGSGGGGSTGGSGGSTSGSGGSTSGSGLNSTGVFDWSPKDRNGSEWGTWQNGTTPREGDTRLTQNGVKQVYKNGQWIPIQNR